MYLINYRTGAGNEQADTLEDAMAAAEKNAAYTQADIHIEDKDGNVVARLPWVGCAAGEDDDVTVDFGEFGFYGEWEEYSPGDYPSSE